MFSKCSADGGDMEKTTSKPPSGVNEPTGVASNKKYCELSSDHTMCKYPGPSDECTAKTTGRAFTEAGKKMILDKHNELDERLQKEKKAQLRSSQKQAT